MRAYVLNKYGGPECASLGEVPVPKPGPGQLLVRVRAAGLNPVDYKIREGKLRLIRSPPLPTILGNELAGEVTELGAGVTGFAVGERVFARVDKDHMDAFAEYACIEAAHAARIPSSLDFTQAAGLPLAGLTALQALRDELHLGPGHKVFISAGAGGVGTFAIQIAKHLGAHVITTASPRGESLVRSLGADEVIDYTRERFEQKLSGLDGALDLLGGESLERTFGIVKPGGKVVSVAGVPEPRTATQDLGRGGALLAIFWLASFGLRWRARRHGVTYRYLFMHPSGAELAELAALVERGALRVVMDQTFPFERIGDAMAHLESGRAKGKVVVQMG
jgi:NADPH:quinone reductase-like Zn-dependent oxidoreductase